jgi:hypothetical protein
MNTEVTRTYPVAVKAGFDYCDDFKTRPLWYSSMIEIIDPEEARWHEPGDEVRFGCKLLGRRIEGVTILDEFADAGRFTRQDRLRPGSFPQIGSVIPPDGRRGGVRGFRDRPADR